MKRRHFATRFRLDGAIRFLIWYSDTRDGAVVDDGGRVASFASLDDAEDFAMLRAIVLDPHGDHLFDFDAIARWAAAPTAAAIDCDAFLSAWDMLLDIADSVGNGRPLSANESAILETLFWGCNLPSTTPAGQHFVPTWTEADIATMRAALTDGLARARWAL